MWWWCNQCDYLTDLWPDATMRGQCKTCSTLVTYIQNSNNNPTSCHQCFYQKAKNVEDPFLKIQLLSVCLSCTTIAQEWGTGWACTQYCNDVQYVDD
eukprot:117155-Chlamydomonas_euryale.AAC.1